MRRTCFEQDFVPEKIRPSQAFRQGPREGGRRSGAFEDDGDALADADAHGAEGVAAVGAQELIERGSDEARAAGTERVADGDGAAVGIDVWRVVREAEVAEDGERLRGESFVELDDVHLRELQTSFREDFARRRRW